MPLENFLLNELASVLPESSSEMSRVSIKNVEKTLEFIENDFSVVIEKDDDTTYNFEHSEMGKFYISFQDYEAFTILKGISLEKSLPKEALMKLLDLNLDYDFVKNAISEDVLIFAGQIPLSSVNIATYDLLILNLMRLMSESLEVVEPYMSPEVEVSKKQSSARPNVGVYTPSDNVRRIDVLDRVFSIYPDKGWKLTSSESDDESHVIEMRKGTKFVKIIAEALPLGLTQEFIKELLIYNMDQADAAYEFKEEGVRSIDGQQVYWASVDATMKGMDLNYEYSVYSGKEGMIQIIMYTFGHGISKETLKEAMELSQTFTVN